MSAAGAPRQPATCFLSLINSLFCISRLCLFLPLQPKTLFLFISSRLVSSLLLSKYSLLSTHQHQPNLQLTLRLAHHSSRDNPIPPLLPAFCSAAAAMPAYLCHGFRWQRADVRIHVIMNDLEEAAPDWIVGTTTASLILNNFADNFDFVPVQEHAKLHPVKPIANGITHASPDAVDGTTRDGVPDDAVLRHAWSPVKLLEEYDPTNETFHTRPYAYVADYAVRVDLGASITDEMARYDEHTKVYTSSSWFEQLRDKVQNGAAIGWHVVVCGDGDREVPADENEGARDEQNTVEASVPVKETEPVIEAIEPVTAAESTENSTEVVEAQETDKSEVLLAPLTIRTKHEREPDPVTPIKVEKIRLSTKQLSDADSYRSEDRAAADLDSPAPLLATPGASSIHGDEWPLPNSPQPSGHDLTPRESTSRDYSHMTPPPVPDDSPSGKPRQSLRRKLSLKRLFNRKESAEWKTSTTSTTSSG